MPVQFKMLSFSNLGTNNGILAKSRWQLRPIYTLIRIIAHLVLKGNSTLDKMTSVRRKSVKWF
jgi:hypothetical protein